MAEFEYSSRREGREEDSCDWRQLWRSQLWERIQHFRLNLGYSHSGILELLVVNGHALRHSDADRFLEDLQEQMNPQRGVITLTESELYFIVDQARATGREFQSLYEATKRGEHSKEKREGVERTQSELFKMINNAIAGKRLID
tara:strand:+ start:507 stop:938 length:432 start_codon:yes stop_codon:yes gene_type:complete